jgi:hypothetical protein
LPKKPGRRKGGAGVGRANLKLLRDKLLPPLSQKTLRTFFYGEATQRIDVQACNSLCT